jgi:hypothetical protein
VGVSVLSDFLNLRAAQDEHPAWGLLRKHNAALIIAILDNHFSEQNRRIIVSDLANLVEVDLEDLRFRANIDYEKSGAAACEDWRRAGFLRRRPLKENRQETYELTPGALGAISYVKGLVAPRRSATQSRLSNIIDAIHRLTVETDQNDARRIKFLEAERAKIDAQIEAIKRGERTQADADNAVEQLEEIVALVSEIPADFARVSMDFETINRRLYEKIINYDDDCQNILEDTFAGIDHISQSASGKSFKGFYDLLRNNAQIDTLQDDIDRLLATPYAADISPDSRRILHSMISNFMDQSAEVNEVKTSLARGLRRFVLSQTYTQEQQLKRTLDKALAGCRRLTDCKISSREVLFEIDLTQVQLQPIWRHKLYNPAAEEPARPVDLRIQQGGAVSLQALFEAARATEIDYHELAQNINHTLQISYRQNAEEIEGAEGSEGVTGGRHAGGKREAGASDTFGISCENTPAHWLTPGCVSVEDVLLLHPATQGVASIIGLLSLGFAHGVSGAGTQLVSWENDAGARAMAQIDNVYFVKEIEV